MKFKSIAVGDLVCIQDQIQNELDEYYGFWLPKEVKRVTAKQFTVDGKRYRKEDGRCIGDKYSEPAKQIGEEKNQTEERNLLIRKINAECEIPKLTKELEVDHNDKNLFIILEKLIELKTLTAGDDNE